MGEPQNLVSYHLRQLRDGGLVTSQRSSADGRDSYYAIDLTRCRDELQSAGGALHLGRARAGRARSANDEASAIRVRCSCAAGNSARSQIAAALLGELADGNDRRRERGQPSQATPSERGASHAWTAGSTSAATRTKHLDEYRAQRFDLVVQPLRDKVPGRSVPSSPASRRRVPHWSMADPEADGRRTTRPPTPPSVVPPGSPRSASISCSSCPYLFAQPREEPRMSDDATVQRPRDPASTTPPLRSTLSTTHFGFTELTCVPRRRSPTCSAATCWGPLLSGSRGARPVAP